MNFQTRFRKGKVRIMRNKTKRRVSLFIMLAMVLSMFQGFLIYTREAKASPWPAVSNSKYLKCYTISTGNNTTAYTSSSLRTKKGTIYGTDELYVYSINDTYAYISYPVSNGRKYAYIPTSVISSNNQAHVQTTAREKITTYKRAGVGTYGYISKGDQVMRVAVSGSYSQVIYPTGTTMKMGWITTAAYNSYIAVQGTNGSGAGNEYSSNSSGAKLGSYGSGKVKCFTLARSGRVYAYDDAALRYKNNGRYIDCATDEVYVQSVNIAYGSVLLSYPVSGGRRNMYFKLSDIMANPGSRPYTFYANHKIITYQRASTEKQYGYIQNEEVTVVGTSGSFTQIIYSIGSGNYKMGFIKTADIEGTGNVSSGNGGQTADTSGLAQKIVDYELSQVGVSDYQGNNNVPYNTWYYGRTVNGSGYAWCMAFQAYSANQFGVLNKAIPKTASCTQAVNWYKSRGQFHYSKYYGGNYTPKAGDLVFYYDTSSKSICHVGMIIAAPVNGYLQTVEGNIQCSDGNWKVQKFIKNAKRTVSHSYVYGYASPAY